MERDRGKINDRFFLRDVILQWLIIIRLFKMSSSRYKKVCLTLVNIILLILRQGYNEDYFIKNGYGGWELAANNIFAGEW